ncbi:hypothetical protein BASA81_007360 [Batrachochytrium salamandrivorans]|nr:hypothetical protein BASA81_007360 [Batrachochytrium salamandrivorans]
MLDNLLGREEEGMGEEITAPLSRLNRLKKCCKLPFDVKQIRLRFWFHLLLLLAATCQLFVDTKESQYLLSSKRNWMHFFLPEDYELNPTDDEPAENYYLYTRDEFLGAVKHSLEAYESIVEDSLDALSYRIPDLDRDFNDEDEEEDDAPPLVKMVVEQYTNPFVYDWKSKKLGDNMVNQTEYWVNSTTFLDSKLFQSRREIRRITNLKLSFQLVSTELNSLRRACLVWNIDLLFEFQYRGQIAMTMREQVVRDCDDTVSKEDIVALGELLWLNLVLLMLSLAYFISTCIEIEANHLFSMWRVSEMICLLCLTISSGMNLNDNSARKPTAIFHSAVISLGQGLLWVNLIQYFSLNQNVLVLTLERTIPRVLKFLLEITPIFVGYAMFGLSFYSSQTVRFSDLKSAFATLFSLLNGDAIQETFQDLMELNAGVAQAYVYTFIMVGSYVILNIVIALVEEAYFAAKDIHDLHGKTENNAEPMQGRFGMRRRRFLSNAANAQEEEEEDDREGL